MLEIQNKSEKLQLCNNQIEILEKSIKLIKASWAVDEAVKRKQDSKSYFKSLISPYIGFSSGVVIYDLKSLIQRHDKEENFCTNIHVERYKRKIENLSEIRNSLESNEKVFLSDDQYSLLTNDKYRKENNSLEIELIEELNFNSVPVHLEDILDKVDTS